MDRISYRENKSISVAFDVGRLITALNRGWIYTGITKYVERLFSFTPQEDITFTPIILESDYLPYLKIKNNIDSRLGREPIVLVNEFSENKELLHFDIFHSPINPLPTGTLRNSVRRIITIHDCIHLKFPEFYPKGNPPIREVIDSISCEEDYAICVSEVTRSDFLSFINMPYDHTCVIPSAADQLFFNRIEGKSVIDELLHT